MTNSLAIFAAPGEPFIQVTGIGLWSAADFEAHFRALDRELRIMRARAGFARVLVDLSAALVQTGEVADVMTHWTGQIYRSKDEVAVICGTTLLAMQVRREPRHYQRQIFRKKPEAVTWLMSDKRQAASSKSA